MLPSPVRGVRAAFAFLTRIPVGGFPYRSSDWTWAAAHAPLVGAVLGAVVGLVDRALLPLGALPAALLAIGASLLLTGAFHEDGLADTSDALGGGYDRARVLSILKDSRIGSFGGAALVISIGARAALVAELGTRATWALALVGCLARVGPIWLMATLPYVTSDGSSKSGAVARGSARQAVVATLWTVIATIAARQMGALDWSRAAGLFAVLVGVSVGTGWRYMRRVGGLTGDFLGATEQLGEIATLAVLVWKA